MTVTRTPSSRSGRDGSRRLLQALGVTAVVGAGLLVAIAGPAEAATARTLTAKLATTTAYSKASDAVSGVLSRSPKGSAVSLQQLSGRTWKTVRSVRTTTSGGRFATTVALPATAGMYSYRAYAPATKTLRATASATTRIAVRVRVSSVAVSLAASASSVNAGNIVTLSGTVTPSSVGASVLLSTVSGSTSTPRGTVHQTSGGAYSFTFVPDATATYRADVPARTGFSAASSPPVAVTVVPVVPTAPVIATSTLPDGTVGSAYSAFLSTRSGERGTWSVVSGSLPAGVTLHPISGALTGTPSTVGDSTVALTFTGTSSGLQASRSFSIHVDPAVPSTLPNGPTVLSAGGDHTCRVNPDHTLWCWGANDKNQLGVPMNPTVPVETSPTRVGTANTWTSVSAGSFADTCGVQADHSLWCWGANFSGADGVGNEDHVSAPTRIGAGRHWLSVSVGIFHACAVTTSRALWCWGDNTSGATGLNTADAIVYLPTRVGTASDWASVQADGYTSCGLRTTGTLWCWGANYQGELGQGTSGGTAGAPVQVGTATDWTSFAVGAASVCGIRSSGALWCWGDDHHGQLGDGGGIQQNLPVQIGTAMWTSVDAGGQAISAHTCGVQTDGSLWCWGGNAFGAVGDGTTTDRATPVLVGPGWDAVSAGGAHTCAVEVDGSQWCWGSNYHGDLGIGGKRGGERLAPVPVLG